MPAVGIGDKWRMLLLHHVVALMSWCCRYSKLILRMNCKDLLTDRASLNVFIDLATVWAVLE